jgi:thymidylate synthase
VVWQDVQLVAKHNPDLLNQFSVIGNLRSTFGINIMLYNLALNPHITEVVVWGPDKLSNTPIGVAGRNSLLELWTRKERTDVIVPEIEDTHLNKILSSVKVVDVSDQPKPDFSTMPPEEATPYMKPIVFPEFKVEAPDTMPSERYIYPIREQKGADAYLTLLHTVWKYGTKTKIDDDSEEVKEIRGATVVIERENPDDFYLPDWLTKAKSFGITKHSLDEYYKSQFSAEPYRKEIFPGVYIFDRPRDYSYLYAELMYAFPRQEMTDDSVKEIFAEKGYEAAKKFIMHHTTLSKPAAEKLIKQIEKKIKKDDERIRTLLEGLIPTIDQIAYVIERIKRKPYDLDKEVVLWDQRYHTQMESGRPCLFKFSFTVRNDYVDIHVFVRSHDIGRAWFFNFYGINQLLGNIAKETGYKPGLITIESQSAHIYQRDWKNVDEFLKQQVVDKIPRMFFDPDRDSDPRGVVQVAVVDNMIKAKLLDTGTGKQLFELEGRSARELLYKLKHFNFISRVDHAAFIGSELAKAEICMKMGIEYKYDNPIILPNKEKILS